jgi:maleamate amidohydrolase
VSTGDVYAERGFGGRSPEGRQPCLVVVDFSLGFTDPGSPLHCDCDDALAATARLLVAARGAGAPVVFTTVVYGKADLEVARAFIAKAPALRELTPGSRWAQIDPRIAPEPDEAVLPKLFASAFFGTALASLLVARGCDSVIVAGASTSGCVRATAVDAVQHGYPTLVVREAVADRAAGAHDGALLDLDAKYADVIGVVDAVARLAAST